jgi:zinc transporter ZupT
MPSITSNSDTRIGSALIIALVDLLIPTGLVIFLVLRNWQSNDIVGVVGLFTGLIGTLVGAFLGVQVGATGKQKAENIARRALAALPPEQAQALTQ